MADEAVVTQEIVEVLVVADRAALVTQEVVEVAVFPNPSALVTQEVVEVAVFPNPSVVVTQEIIEVLIPPTNPGGDARLTQQTAEIAFGAAAPGNLTQVAAEVLIGTFIPGLLSQVAVEVLVPNRVSPYSMNLEFDVGSPVGVGDDPGSGAETAVSMYFRMSDKN